MRGAGAILRTDSGTTFKSYELFARYVMPAVNGMNRARGESLAWAHSNSLGAMMGGIAKAVADHETEPTDRGRGTAWGTGTPLVGGRR